MNKKQNLIAIALSASFILGGANVAHASGNSISPVVEEENIDTQVDKNVVENNPAATIPQKTEKDEEGKDAGKEEALSNSTVQNNKKVTADSTNRSANINENADAEPVSLQISEEKTPEAQKAFELKKPNPVGVYDPKNLTDEEIESVKKAVISANPDLKKTPITVSKDGKVIFTDPDGNEQTLNSADTVVKDYGIDEAKIKDYNSSERYRQTDLTPGSTIVGNVSTDEGKEKDGFKFKTLNPSASSPDKKAYGYEITIDKKTGQRTYTKVVVTDSGLIPVNTGDKPMMGEGEKLTPDSPDVTYKPGENGEMTAGGRQRNYDYEASEDTLKHINSNDNSSTVIGMKDNYTKDNPRKKFFEENFAITYKVNPWPNENDNLQLMKLNGEYNEKVFVQGQDLDTGIKVDNVDENAKERLVGQVYHPVTGKIVPGAKAYIANDDKIHIQMPDGAINKDGSINKESIFYKDPTFKGIQSLDVKFFARPRTADEFKAIAQAPKDELDRGTYVETGAGTATINHKGKDVTIDKQGIDRYDHYNLVGNFKLNLDDTKFYNQKFKDQDGRPTLDHVFSEVEPGKDFSVNMNDYSSEKDKKEKDEFDKTPEDMKNAQAAQQATGTVNLKFFKENNKGKAPEDQWKISIGGKEINLDEVGDKIYKNDLSDIKITAPSSAKAGEFVAVPIEYTYTNGSNDVHWFHFVVKESDNNIPTYDSEAGTAGIELSQKPIISDAPKDIKKNQPVSYKLANTKYKDDKDNVWNVSIDEKTGEVKATVPDNANIPEKGAKLDVDVVVTYEEEVTINGRTEKRTYTEKTKAQFYSIPSTKQEVKKEFKSELPYKTTFEYDNTIPAGKVVEEGGVVGKQKLVFSQIVVGNKKGALDENGKFVEGKEAVSTEIITPAVDKVIKIGTKPAETTVEIPKGLDYELDYSKKDGEPEVVEEGNDGVVTIKTTRNPQTGEITVTKTTTTEAKNKKIKIPAGTEGTHEYTEKKPFTYDVQFDPDFYKNYPDAKDNYKIVTEGKVGEKTTKWTIKNSKIVGEPEVTETNPTNAVIKVGQKDYTGTITHTESHEVPFEVEYKYSDELEAGQTKVEQKGEKGSYDVEYSQKIKNGEKDGELTSTKKNEKAAKKEIVIIGTKPVTKVVEKPFNTEYVYDENLEAGKTEEVTPGKNGKVTITTSYDKDQKKVVTSETEEAGQNRVVKIGGKTNGTEKVKEEIPFEVEVRKDPSLKKGEWKYAKDDEGNELKGEKGEQEKILTIENSKVTNTSEPTVTKKAKNAVILVGEGTNDGTHEIKEKKALPFETKIVYDENLEAGQREETGGEPGEQERTNTLVIKDGKVTETKEGEFKTTKDPVDKVIKIGIKPIVKEVEKPFETEYIYDENVEVGKEEEVTPGEKGKVTITTSYDKDQNKLVTKEETKDPVKRVVKVGTKPIVKIEEIPFEKEYEHDPNLKAGTTKLISEGKKGEVKVTTTFNKETGKLETKVERTEPTPAKYKYGSKTEGEVKVTSDIPYEVEFVPDDTMAAGETKVTQEGELGKKEITITIENSKEVRRTEEITKKPVKKIVKIGTLCKAPTPNPEDKDNPSKPSGDKPNPNKPGIPEETPDEPSTPEETPEKPEKPGDEKPNEYKPNEPGKPGNPDKTPEKPQEPGRPEGENPVDKENPKSQDLQKENTEEAEKEKNKNNFSDELSRKGNNKSTNPKTGIGSITPILSSMGISIAGLIATRKKKEEDDE